MTPPMYRSLVHSRPSVHALMSRKLVKMASMSTLSDAPLAPLARAIPQEVNPSSLSRLKFVDIGVNLGDPVFQGIYHGKKAHESDLEDVIQRAAAAGCLKMMITGSDLEQSKIAVKLAEDHRTFNYWVPSHFKILSSISCCYFAMHYPAQ